MGMFTNYHNIADNYVPNNLIKAYPTKCVPTKLNPIEASKPYEDYNAKGDLCGYFWRYGESINLEFNLDGEITVENDAIIYVANTDVPLYNTVGYIGQRAYNITTLNSWTCTNIIDDVYVWTHDAEFTYPESDGTSIYLSADDYLKDKNIRVTLYNFRMQPIDTRVFAGTPKIIYKINPEQSALMPRGIYYCSVDVFNSETSIKVFDPTDGKLLVK